MSIEQPAGIRGARAADGPAWLAMWNAFVTSGPEPCAPDAPALAWSRILDPQNPLKCLIAEDAAGQQVGFLVYATQPYGWSRRPICYLQDLYVAPDARGRGRGRALIDALARIGRDAGWLRIYWMTQADNAIAQTLYDRVAKRSPLVRYDLQLAEP